MTKTMIEEVTLNPSDIRSDIQVKVNPKNFAKCDKHFISLNSQGYCQKCYEEQITNFKKEK